MQTFHDLVSYIRGSVSLVVAAAALGLVTPASGEPIARSAIDWRAAPVVATVPLPVNSSIVLTRSTRASVSSAYRIIVPTGAALSVSLITAKAPIALIAVDELSGAVLFDGSAHDPAKPIETRGPRSLLIAVSAGEETTFSLFMQMK